MRSGDGQPRGRVHVSVWSSGELKEGISKERRVLEQGMAEGSPCASFPPQPSPPWHPSLQVTEADLTTEILTGPNEMAAAWASPHD